MSELWYFTSEGKQMEPVTTAELRQLASTGFLRPTDMVWKEGMASWAKASTVNGLFPAAAPRAAGAAGAAGASSTGVKARDPSAAPQRAVARPAAKVERVERVERERDREPVEDDAPRTRRRREEEDDEDDYDRPKRRRKSKQGMSGLTIGLIIGGAVLGLFLVCGGIVFVATRGGGGGGVVNNGDPNNFTVSIPAGQFHSRDINFNAGTLYEISVRSDTRQRRGQICDVDCIVENNMGQWVSGDDSVGPDSFVRFSPPANGVYKLKVENLDPQTANRATVTIKNAGPSNGVVTMMPQFPRPDRPVAFLNPNPNPIPNPFPNPIPNPKVPIGGGPMTTDPPVQIAANQNFEKMVTYNAPKLVTVVVTSLPKVNDVDLFVTDQQGRDVGADVRIAPDCRVTFQAQPNMVYRLRVNNLGPQAANCTLSYTTP